MNRPTAFRVSFTPGCAASSKVKSIIKWEIEKFLLQIPRQCATSNFWDGEQVRGPKERCKKEWGKSIEKKIKIHVGLNKSRSSTAEILDLGFKVQSVPLPLAI